MSFETGSKLIIAIGLLMDIVIIRSIFLAYDVIPDQLEIFINSGKYEIIKVSSIRCNTLHRFEATDNHLLSAEVYYRYKLNEKTK